MRGRACHSRESGNLAYTLAYRLAAMALVIIIIIHPTLSLAGDAGIPLSKISDVDYLVYHHGDHLGSTHMITEGKKTGLHAGISYPRGTVIQRFEYLPWGQEAFALNPNQTYDPRFTGQEYDIETGLYFYKAQYYNPALGRFIQPDSIVPDPTDPQSYNRYAYVRNNPLKYTDPSGHEFEQFHFTDDDTGKPLKEEREKKFNEIKNEAYENAVETGVIDPTTSGGLAGNTTNANRNDYLGAAESSRYSANFYFDYNNSGFANSGGSINWSRVAFGALEIIGGIASIAGAATIELGTLGFGTAGAFILAVVGATGIGHGVPEIIAGFSNNPERIPSVSLPSMITYAATQDYVKAEKVDFVFNAVLLGGGLMGATTRNIKNLEAVGLMTDTTLLFKQADVWFDYKKK